MVAHPASRPRPRFPHRRRPDRQGHAKRPLSQLGRPHAHRRRPRAHPHAAGGLAARVGSPAPLRARPIESVFMDDRNFTFLFYGFAAAWGILAAYVVTLASRESNLKRQIENLKRMLEDKETSKS
ncbi:MAG: CcmD family protein [Acidobacteria bacterium]|nr:CcmD family protein [Acidobacteriota bacterium]